MAYVPPLYPYDKDPTDPKGMRMFKDIQKYSNPLSFNNMIVPVLMKKGTLFEWVDFNVVRMEIVIQAKLYEFVKIEGEKRNQNPEINTNCSLLIAVFGLTSRRAMRGLLSSIAEMSTTLNDLNLSVTSFNETSMTLQGIAKGKYPFATHVEIKCYQLEKDSIRGFDPDLILYGIHREATPPLFAP